MVTFHGKGVSGGVAVGPLYFYRRAGDPVPRRTVPDPGAEWLRFQSAQSNAVKQLGMLSEKARAEAGGDAALLFEIHQMMAEDPDYAEVIRQLIQTQALNAEAAVLDASVQFARMFEDMEDPYLQARACDVKDVSRRILAILMGTEANCIQSPVPVILAADDLSPSETVQLERTKILGLLTSDGSASGHTAILARTLGIPAVIGIGDALRPELEGREVLLDGTAGSVTVDPGSAAQAALREIQKASQAKCRLLDALRGLENRTLDGRKVELLCNIASPGDVAAVKANDGGGIGLFRSEFLYLQCDDYPDEERQFQAYRQVLSAMDDKPVIIRTLDIGADKQIGYFGLRREENPAMGLRALRICLTRPELFRTQLRALYRASAYGRLRILFPMVASLWEVRACKAACEAVARELAAEGIPFSGAIPLGIMVETPAAVLISDQLAAEVDFLCIGTNDLTQYTLACDRQSDELEAFFDPRHPAVLRSIQTVADNAHRAGKWVGVCGELAADPESVGTLLTLGVDELSVSPSAVLPLRQTIRTLNLANLRFSL